MTRNTKLSNLSIAAIALLAASVPCFAQTQSAESRGRNQTLLRWLILNWQCPSAGPSLQPTSHVLAYSTSSRRVSLTSRPAKNLTSLSPAAFKMRMGQVSAVENQHFFGQQTTIYEMGLGNFKKQFRADDDSSACRTRKSASPSFHRSARNCLRLSR